MPEAPPPRIASARQAQLLTDPELWSLLALLLSGPHSATEAAARLGWPFPRVHYLLRKLAAAGVAEVAQVEARAGRPVQRYQVPQPWFVPFEATGAHDLEAFLAEQVQPRMGAFTARVAAALLARRDHWGFWVAEDSFNLTGPDGETPFDVEEVVLAHWTNVRLAPADVPLFRERMFDLVKEFNGRASETDQEHMLGVFCVRGAMQ